METSSVCLVQYTIISPSQSARPWSRQLFKTAQTRCVYQHIVGFLAAYPDIDGPPRGSMCGLFDGKTSAERNPVESEEFPSGEPAGFSQTPYPSRPFHSSRCRRCRFLPARAQESRIHSKRRFRLEPGTVYGTPSLSILRRCGCRVPQPELERIAGFAIPPSDGRGGPPALCDDRTRKRIHRAIGC